LETYIGSNGEGVRHTERWKAGHLEMWADKIIYC
jgi:hypothetical protein